MENLVGAQDVRQLWITNDLVVGCGAYRHFERQRKFSACAEPDKECSPMRRHQQPHIDRCFNIDEPTSGTPTVRQTNARQGPLEYGNRVDGIGSPLSVLAAVGGIP